MTVFSAAKALIVPLAVAGLLPWSLRPALSQTVAQTPSAETTIFQCISTNQTGQYATIARRGQLVTPPMIVWRQTQYYTPQQRCQIVSDRLTGAVRANGGKFGNLLLTYGPVNGQSVICYVSSQSGRCASNNVLLTLSPSDRGHELSILNQLVTFGTEGSGGPLLRGRPQQQFANLGTQLEQYLGTDESETSGTSDGI